MSDVPRADAPVPRLTRLPFYYGWIVVAVAFVTMGIGVNIRTAFSLLYPPILAEFGWSRGATAGAFSVGFIVSAFMSPVLGYVMDRFGPRRVIPCGAVLVTIGLGLATYTARPWHLYLSLGILVGTGSVIFTYIGHSMFLPHWFRRRQGLAIGVAFSGVGIGSILLFPWLQAIIGHGGWRQACWTMAAILAAVVLPLNLLLQRKRPEDMGLLPDGDREPATPAPAADPAAGAAPASGPGAEWTLRRALRSAPLWWISGAYFCGLIAWYLVQVHQTKYLTEIGISPEAAAYALGFVPLTGIVGQVVLGHLSDRIGREWAYTISALGFAACYALLMLMRTYPSPLLMYLMVAAQGGLGYGLTSVFGAIPAEIFRGPAFGTIFGIISIASNFGAAVGAWIGGVSQDLYGSYSPAFFLGIVVSLVSIACIWLAAPRKGPIRLARQPVRARA